MRTRYSMLLAAAAMAVGLSPALPTISARAETVVRYGISMADIPLTTGQPDRGAGAYQFSAYTIYDPLVAWAAMAAKASSQTAGLKCSLQASNLAPFFHAE